MTDLPLTGGCLCGAVRFTLDKQPVIAGYCHCSRCQRRTGTAAAMSTLIEPGSLTVEGEEHVTAWKPPDEGFLKAFCSHCGSHLWAQSPADPDVRAIRMGAFDTAPDIAPSYRQFLDSAAPWEPIPDDAIPRYAGRRPL
jgi:hypothetical protein